MPDVADWLETLGLGQYARIFDENGIDFDILPTLTDQDLTKLGVLLGHRKRLLRAFQTLRRPDSLKQAPPPETAASNLGERRQVTLLFCDLVGSTALSTRLDPEDLRRVYRSYRDACLRVARRYDGTISQFMGDGVLLNFGYPRAHEDDGERAVRAALDIIAAVGWLRTPAGERIQARAGIATGLVVVDDLVRHGFGHEQSVIGVTANLAARLQSVADPGAVVVAGSTRELLGQVFRLRALGRLEVKGVEQPVEAWKVEGEAALSSRFEMVRPLRLAGFVGREQEIALLTERQVQAWRGEGQVVAISGEAGIGKSRFITQFRESLATQPHTLLRLQCSPYHMMSAFHPVIEHLKWAAQLKADDTVPAKLEKLEATLALATQAVADVAPLFAALLSLPSGDRYPPLDLTAAQRRQRLMIACLDQLEGLASKQPVLVVFEDAQWADASSLEILGLMADRVRSLPILIVVTNRPEFELPWQSASNLSALELHRLEANQVEELIYQLCDGKSVPGEVVAQIIAKADGVPLFVEELTRTIRESGVLVEEVEGFRLKGRLPALAIPATLQDSLMARLDRQASVKEIAQIGAVIGREFPYTLLQEIADASNAKLDAALAQLERAGLLFRIGKPPDLRYCFTHALLQEAASASLLKSRRVSLHQRIAETMRDRFPMMAEAQPELVAQHFAEAGLTIAAVKWWSLAGERAFARSAYIEAGADYHQAVTLADTVPTDPTWLRRRLNLYLAYGQALIVGRGHGARETTEAFVQARALANEANDPKSALAALYGLWAGSNVRGELATASALADDFLNDAKKQAELPEIGVGHWIVGMTDFMAGRLHSAQDHLERAVAIYDARRDRELRFRFGQDPGVAAMFQLAMVLWQLGRIERALQLADAATTLALQTNHVPTMACGLGCRCLFEGMRNNAAGAQPYAEALSQLIREHALQSIWEGIGAFFRGWALRDDAGAEVDIADMRKGVSHLREHGFLLYSALLYGLLATAEAAAGNAYRALATVDVAIADSDRTGHRWYQSDLYRIRAEILLGREPGDPAAVTCYRRALDIAREAGAKMLELRAILGLCRLHDATAREKRLRIELEPLLAELSHEIALVEGTAEAGLRPARHSKANTTSRVEAIAVWANRDS